MSQQMPPTLGIFAEPTQIDLAKPDALQVATIHDQAEIVRTLLDRGINVDQPCPQNWTALEVASLYGRSAIAQILLSRGANPNIVRLGRVPLHLAATKGHADVLVLLLKSTTNVNIKTADGDNALHLAADNGRANVIRILAENMTNLDEPSGDRRYTALHLASRQGYSQCVSKLLSAGANPNAAAERGVTPLMAAAISDRAAAATTLLDSGAEIDAQTDQGVTASSLAGYNGSTSVLEVLISRGAVFDRMDDQGYDALRGAIYGNKLNTALLLLQQSYPVRIHYGDHQQTALHMAVSQNQYEVVEALLDKDVDTEACDRDGDTALQYAVEADRIKMVKILLRNGARINKQNNKTGETVLHWAVKCGLTSMTQALLAHGSDPSLVDLSALQKKESYPGHKEIYDDDFETCKILVESALLTEGEIRPAEQFEWPLTRDCDDSGGELHEAELLLSTKPDPPRRIDNPIIEMADQEAVASLISSFQDKIVHKGVKCLGPHCSFQSGDLHGIRYRCTRCDELNLCSICVGSNVNSHNNQHPMTKCYLPTQFYAVYEIDENMKKKMALTDSDGSGNPEDVSHVMYVITDQQALSQLQGSLGQAMDVNWLHVASLLGEPTFFPVYKKSRSKKLDSRALQVTSSLEKEPKVEEPERVFHYEDDAHLARVVLGSVKRFDYQQDKIFYTWAEEGRAVTRLVALKPGAFHDKLEIELRVVDIEQASSYEALSYTWKETAYERSLTKGRSKEEDLKLRQTRKVRHAIYSHNAAGDEVFWTINTGLRDALLRLRDPHQTKTLWIDQLCINQRNLSERAFQVKLMPAFYNRAQQVIVWTGDEDEQTRVVFDLYEKIARVRRELKRIPKLDEFLRVTAIAAISPSTLMAMFDFFHRPVFGRSWCIQEIVVGRQVRVRCGTCEIDWADLGSAALVLISGAWETAIEDHPIAVEKNRGVSREADIPGVETWVTQLHGTILEAVGIDELRGMFQSGQETSLERLLYTTSRFQTSEVKDKIYSVLGIRGLNIPLGSTDGVIPNYEISDAETFITATKFCITQSGNMHVCGMMVSVSSKRIVGLPSWVPDYTTNDLSNGLSFCRPSPKIPYNACGDVPSTAAWPYEQHRNILVTSSCYVGTVRTSSQHIMPVEEKFSAIMAEWTSLADIIPVYPTGERLADVFVLTCFADSASVYRYRPHPDAQGFLDAAKLLIANSCVENMRANRSESDQMTLGTFTSRIAQTIMGESFMKFAKIVNVRIEAGGDATPKYQSPDQDISNAYSYMDLSEGGSSSHDDRPSSTEVENLGDSTNESTVCVETPPVKREDKGKGRAVDDSPPTKRKIILDEKAPKAKVDPELHRQAVKSVFGACRDRKLLITSENYIGLGPRDMQSGDEVHILSGTKVPFVLRKITAATADANHVDPAMIGTAADDGLNLYRMIGECFVHGFMHGEVMERADLPWDGIALC